MSSRAYQVQLQVCDGPIQSLQELSNYSDLQSGQQWTSHAVRAVEPGDCTRGIPIKDDTVLGTNDFIGQDMKSLMASIKILVVPIPGRR